MNGVRAACKAHDVNIVLGISERDAGTLYNSQVYIGDTGDIVGVHQAPANDA
ncbi:MAG: nitrilase-related carbon-nitrogen hydrolase [Gammaproteobacteria bacterium]